MAAIKNSKPEETPEYILLNRCKRCGIRGGKYTDKATFEKVGVFLYNDSRGYKICNICAKAGFLIRPVKLNKKERKEQKAIRREMKKVISIPHITLDKEGNRV